MRKSGLIVGIVIVVLGAAVLAGPRLYLSGAEERLRASTEALSQPFAYRVTLASFEPGWFSSEAVSVVELSGYYAQMYDESQSELNLPFDPPQLELRHVIRHGPLIWTDDGPKFAASIVETTMQTPESFRPTAEEYFGDQPLLKINTAFGFDGSSLSTFSSPARIAPAGTEPQALGIPWPGISGTVSSAGKTVTFESQVPAWSISGKGGQASLSPINLVGNLEQFRDITWLGDFWLTIDRVDIQAGPGASSQPFFVSGIRYGGEMRETDGLVDMHFLAGIDAGEGQGARLGANAYKVALQGISADAWAEAYRAFYQSMDAGSSGEDPQAQLVKYYTEEIPKLLRGSESLSLGIDYDFETPQMKMSGASSVSLGASEGSPEVRLDVTFGETRFGDIALDAGTAKMALTGLSAEAMPALWQEIMRSYDALLSNPGATVESDAALDEQFRKLITADTMLSIDPFSISLPAGDLNATAQASLSEPETIDWDNSNAARQRLNATLDAEAAEGALVRIMALATLETYRTALAQQGLPSDTATALSYAEEGARGQLIPFLGQGLLVKEAENYKLNLKLEGERLFVNGNEIANPMMAQ